jgi:hypothetical protein
MPIYIEEEQESVIPYVLLVIVLIVIAAVGYLLLDREPVKERQALCVVTSNGWEHIYPVNGRNVKLIYEDVE